MSGHSRWSQIKRKKGKTDVERGKLFSKILREITVAARNGGGDPKGNMRLKAAMETARAANMPADNIKRAIQKGAGELPGEQLEEITYEGYGPGGVAILLNVVTDNKNRTGPEIRHAFEKNGGRMGTAAPLQPRGEKMEKNSGSKATRLGLILLAGSLSLLAGAGASAAPCNQGVCKAVVKVQSCEKGTMSVAPDPIDVPAPNNIEWTITTDGYVFTKDGIVVDGKGFTPKPGMTGNGKKFIVHDDHTDNRKGIKYVVRVKRLSDGVICKEYDPFINN